MKMNGGFLPKISGKPASIVEVVPTPERLIISLTQKGVAYKSIVTSGSSVKAGAPIAEASIAGGKVFLPSPANGTVTLDNSKGADRIVIKCTSRQEQAAVVRSPMDPATATAENIRKVLAEDGLWTSLWSSSSKGIPALNDSAKPKSIVISCVISEPFRARGKVLLKRSWEAILKGMRFLPRLLADYGSIDIVLTDKQDPVARMMYLELAGHAWVHFHTVKVAYPAEHPVVLTDALRKTKKNLKPEDTIWVIDLQTVEAIGTGLADGNLLTRRVVTVGGPGCDNPRHLSVTAGTPVALLAKLAGVKDKAAILKGGILKGEPIDPETAGVDFCDDGFFFLPEAEKREFLGFVTPGFDRTSFFPCFGSNLTGSLDRNITKSTRGEQRPCIACGACEHICPANLFPQILHRYLYRDGIDEAAATGLMLCIGCNACSYVCPSKLELSHQFGQAQKRILIEKAEAAAAAEALKRREETKQHEEERSEDWRK